MCSTNASSGDTAFLKDYDSDEHPEYTDPCSPPSSSSDEEEIASSRTLLQQQIDTPTLAASTPAANSKVIPGSHKLKQDKKTLKKSKKSRSYNTGVQSLNGNQVI